MKHGSITSSGVESAVSWVDNRRWKPSKATKDATSAGKVLADVFWDAQGILFIDYLEKGRTISREYFITLLVRSKEEISKKRPQMKIKVYFH